MLKTKMLSLVQMTYKCRYCNKDFAKESTLMSHMCERKRRMGDKDLKQNRIAYQSWLIYRQLSMQSKTVPKYEDFIANRYYAGFMRVSKFMIDLHMDKPDDYIKFLVMHSVKIDDWCKDSVYQLYIKERTKTETVERAIERSLLNMKAWAERTGNNWQDYFVTASTIDVVQDIKMGRISPWCTFATDQGSKLIDRLEPGQVQALVDHMDPLSWRARVKRQNTDAEWVQHVFNQAEIK